MLYCYQGSDAKEFISFLRGLNPEKRIKTCDLGLLRGTSKICDHFYKTFTLESNESLTNVVDNLWMKYFLDDSSPKDLIVVFGVKFPWEIQKLKQWAENHCHETAIV